MTRTRDLKPLAPRDFRVLLTLASEPLHGYAISRALEDQPCGGMHLDLGSLYRLMSKLLAAGLIEEAPDVEQPTHPGRPRRAYRLTPLGLAAMRAETRRLQELVQVAEKILPAGTGGG